MSQKAISDFSGYTGDALWPAAQAIHDAIPAAGTTFINPAATPPLNPPVSMADFQLHNDAVKQGLVAKTSGAVADTVTFNLARHQLETDLGSLAGFVNTIAQGDVAILNASAFPLYDTVHPADYSAPGAPTSVVPRQGDVSGSAVVRFHPARSGSLSEVQTCIGDPTVEANWKTVGMFSGGKAYISNVVPGTLIWIRIRTYGLKNVVGE